MKLTINGEVNEVPRPYLEKMTAQLLEKGEEEYAKLGTGEGEYQKLFMTARIAAKPFARGFLLLIEKYAEKKYGKGAGLQFRPDRNADPNLFLMRITGRFLLEGLSRYVEVSIETANNVTTSFNVSIPTNISDAIAGKGVSGGQVDTDRYIGMRQDNGA